MASNQERGVVLDIIGKAINGITCHRYYQLNNVVVILDDKGGSKVVLLSSLSSELELYKIDQEVVAQVQVASNEKMFLFHTKTNQYLVNDQNKIVEDSSQWDDSYFDVLSNSFYRKDAQGFWYDIEGFKMKEKVFLKDDVLSSLETKKSKQSLSFVNQDLFISKNGRLIQIGKLVLSVDLEVVKYFGEKITGLGFSHVEFEGEDVLQEVRLGIDDTAFINEYTYRPYMFGDLKITKHLGSHQYGKKRVEVFKTEKKSYGVVGSSDNFLTFNDRALQIETQKHVSFNDTELIKVSDGKKSFYFDLNKNEPFSLPALEDKNLSEIDKEFVRLGQSKIFNVSSSREQFAVHEKTGEVFRLNEGAIKPQKIEDLDILNQYYGYAYIDGVRKMFSKKHSKILKFGKDGLEVSEIIYNASDKLINAIDTNGNKLVLDLRHGFEEVSLALTDGDKILEFYGETMPIGNKTLQNVFVETLGGNAKRVIDINDSSLPCFSLPQSLKQISDQDAPSTFAGSYLCEIDYFNEYKLMDKTFITASFSSFSGKEYPVILDKQTGLPIHLHSVGHQNELASTFVNYTIKQAFYLGDNRMVGVYTIGEDLKESELLFSVKKLDSWLPFYENYLPIFKQVIPTKELGGENWDYHLFELREISKDKEYIAVEKEAPYRILAEKKSGEFHPKIVKSKSKSVKSPDEVNSLQRFFFSDSNILVEVE